MRGKNGVPVSRYIIDGYNLLYQMPEIRKLMERDLEGARRMLIQKLQCFVQHESAELVVVFDGDKRSSMPEGNPSLRILYSRYPEKADPMIRTLISRMASEECVVVSSDNEIRRYAQLYSCKAMHSVQFARLITSKPSLTMDLKADPSVSNEEMEEWLKLFQSGEGDASPDSGAS